MRIVRKRISLSLIVLAFAHIAASAQTPVTLSISEPITREMKSGGSHSYAAAASVGEAIEIVCERKGTDVSITVYDPAGKPVAASNAPGGFAGSVRSFFIAGRAGEYRIDVQADRPGNIFGSYAISLTKRIAIDSDSARAEAMKLLADARPLMRASENRYESAVRAAETLEHAAALFQKAGDQIGEASALSHIASITANEFGDERRAAEVYERAIGVWRRTADEGSLAICLMRAAREFSDKGEHSKAVAFLNEALAINKKQNDRLGEAATLSILCRVYNDTGNFQKGFETCRESQRLGRDEDPLNDWFTYYALAQLNGNTGDMEKSLEYYQVAIRRIQLAGSVLNPIRLAGAKANVGGILFAKQKHADALTYFQDALVVSQQVKRPKWEAYFRARIAETFFETGQFAKALEYGERSLALYREHYPRNRQFILRIVGKIYVALGQTDKACATLLESLEMNRQNNDRYAEAETLFDLARLDQKTGLLDAALQNMRRAIDNSENLRADLLGKSQRSSYFGILQRYYELDIELLIEKFEKTGDARDLEKAWQDQERLRARSLLESFLESGLDLNDPALKTVLEQEQKLREAISVEELKRSQAAKANNTAAAAEASKSLRKALDDYEILYEEIRRHNPKFSALRAPRDFSFADAQKLLDGETVIVEYALGERNSHAWVIGKTAIRHVKLPGRGPITDAVRAFYSALTDQNAADASAAIESSKRLSRQIIEPITKELAGEKRIVVVADGALQLVPFAALNIGPEANFEPVAATKELVNAPSVSSLILVGEEKARRQTQPDKLLAIFADPVFQPDDERLASVTRTSAAGPPDDAGLAHALSAFGLQRLARLPFSGMEAREIAKFRPQETSLISGIDASRQNFLQGGHTSARILHLATHGFLNQQEPELSGIVFSLFDEKRQVRNGFLRVIDVYSMRLDADLVVLSACQTALGKDVDGDGIIGLTRAFMHAGASSVVSSLWKVDDAATAELMKRFYRAMLQDDRLPSAALRIAQNELRQIPRYSHPRYWAGFKFTGGWK